MSSRIAARLRSATAILQQQFDERFDVRTQCGAARLPRATQRRNQRRESEIDRAIRVCSDLEQRANERERAVIDGVDKARTNREGHRAVRYDRRIVDGRAQRIEVAALERIGQLAVLRRLGAALVLGHVTT